MARARRAHKQTKYQNIMAVCSGHMCVCVKGKGKTWNKRKHKHTNPFISITGRLLIFIIKWSHKPLKLLNNFKIQRVEPKVVSSANRKTLNINHRVRRQDSSFIVCKVYSCEMELTFHSIGICLSHMADHNERKSFSSISNYYYYYYYGVVYFGDKLCSTLHKWWNVVSSPYSILIIYKPNVTISQ